MTVRMLLDSDRAELLRMRQAFWPDSLASEVEDRLRLDPDQGVTFVAEGDGGGLVGFVEVELRKFADGCVSSPVPYVEGIWVDRDRRRAGVAAALLQAAEEWCEARGFVEIASDCETSNTSSLLLHLAVGFEEMQRNITFRKRLPGSTA